MSEMMATRLRSMGLSVCNEAAEEIDRLRARNEALGGLAECAKTAIRNGDWEVDGACDPDCYLAKLERANE